MTAPVRPLAADPGTSDGRPPAPTAVRVTLAHGVGPGVPPLVIEPATGPVAGRAEGRPLLLDGEPSGAELRALDPERAVLLRDGADAPGERVLILPPASAPGGGRGVLRREVVVGGWRFEVDVEPAARAALRARALRGRDETGRSGPSEVRAIIPGVVVAVFVEPGEVVTAGQHLLVIEAMKMQNELRAARDGTVERVAVNLRDKIEAGDLLVVIG